MRYQSLNDNLKDVLTATEDTKSSAGDKHETGRAMAHLEQEKIAGQLSEMNKMSEILHRIDSTQKHTKIQLGSLIETSIGVFFISVGIGSIQIENTTIFCMTAAAPLGKELLGKSVGTEIQWQGKKIEILSCQ
jgi:transcription elongation GreA/GreB family factor